MFRRALFLQAAPPFFGDRDVPTVMMGPSESVGIAPLTVVVREFAEARHQWVHSVCSRASERSGVVPNVCVRTAIAARVS